jgi:hypothetical protein
VRWSLNSDTPLPPDEPAGKNPPDGAVIDYYLATNSKDAVQLDITDEAGQTVRTYRSDDKAYEIPAVNIPLYWIRPQQLLSGKAGAHRFVWDMHYQPLNVPASYPMSAIYEDTPPGYSSPWVMPGKYRVILTVDGRKYKQDLVVTMDPRVTAKRRDLRQQHDLSYQCYTRQQQCLTILKEGQELADKLHQQAGRGEKTTAGQAAKLAQRLRQLLNPEKPGKPLSAINGELGTIMGHLQGCDVAPTSQCVAAAADTFATCDSMLAEWQELKEQSKKIIPSK